MCGVSGEIGEGAGVEELDAEWRYGLWLSHCLT